MSDPREKLNKNQHHKSNRKNYMLETYGISQKDYNAFMMAQKQRCGVCKVTQASLDYMLFIDHCHKTGQVRGLLCDACNRNLANNRNTTAREYLHRAWNPEQYYSGPRLKKILRAHKRSRDLFNSGQCQRQST